MPGSLVVALAAVVLNGLRWAVRKLEVLDAAHGKGGHHVWLYVCSFFKLNNELVLYILIYDTICLTVYILLVLN